MGLSLLRPLCPLPLQELNHGCIDAREFNVCLTKSSMKILWYSVTWKTQIALNTHELLKMSCERKSSLFFVRRLFPQLTWTDFGLCWHIQISDEISTTYFDLWLWNRKKEKCSANLQNFIRPHFRVKTLTVQLLPVYAKVRFELFANSLFRHN